MTQPNTLHAMPGMAAQAATDLSHMAAGFADPVQGSQQIFRAGLQAMSHPGRIVPVPVCADLPTHGHAASAQLMLALLDADCRLWLSPSLRASEVATWLRFHTGCQLVDTLAQAHFAWVGGGDAMPRLADFQHGSDEDPHTSTSCVIDLAAARSAAQDVGGWRLQGPGIADVCQLSVSGLPADFEAQWNDNQAQFPRGVDLWLALPDSLIGLPRTTRMHAADAAPKGV